VADVRTRGGAAAAAAAALHTYQRQLREHARVLRRSLDFRRQFVCNHF
jgi:hypothetical protein